MAVVVTSILVVDVCVIAARVLRGPSGGWTATFSGADLSTSTWQRQVGYYGAGNETLDCDTNADANSTVHDGVLALVAAPAGPAAPCPGSRGALPYTSARVAATPSFYATHGDIKVRAKLETRPGMWSAIWLLGSDYAQARWPRCGEIDIAEVAGSRPGVAISTAHFATPQGVEASLAGRSPLGSDLGLAFHTYELRWSKEALTFILDGRAYKTVTRADVERIGPWPFDQPFQLILSLAAGGRLPGRPPAAGVTGRMEVDKVQVSET